MIYLQRYAESGKIGKEESSVLNHAIIEGKPYRFLDEALLGNKENYTDLSLFVGSVEGCRAVLESIGRTLPEPNYYPAELFQFLGREIWLGTGVNVLASMAQGNPVFAKPARRWKLFTGQVFDGGCGFSIIDDIPDGEQLWLSEVVEFNYEYRAYVVDGVLASVAQYTGEDDVEADLATIQRAVEILKQNPNNPSTYAFDWGFTKSGAFLMVEMNHGFAIGRYSGIGDGDYYRFVKAGWEQLISEK